MGLPLSTAVALADLGDGPGGVLGDERVGISGGGFEGGQIIPPAPIAEGNADIAQEGGALDALDGGFGKQGTELVLREGEKIAQGLGEDGFAGLKRGFARFLGVAVPRAGVEAGVAAVDAVAMARRNSSGMLPLLSMVR